MNTELQNKAWSILPKEFKEEVKDCYKTVKAQYRENFHLEVEAASIRDRIIMLEYFFGIHNLTSDAEGEDVLCVPRKKVEEKWQEAYEQEAKYSRAQDSPGARELLYYNRGILSILDTLLDSKCLPDEACNVASNVASNIASSDPKPKPAESKKYKEGDWVKMPNGDIAAITAVGVDNEYSLVSVMKQGVLYVRWQAKDLEPYTEDKQGTKQEPAFFQNGNTHYSGNHFPDVRNMVNTRLHIAAMMMAGALANQNVTIGFGVFEDNQEYITETALMYADALIAECEKGEEV